MERLTENYAPNWLPFYSPDDDGCIMQDLHVDAECAICHDRLAVTRPARSPSPSPNNYASSSESASPPLNPTTPSPPPQDPIESESGEGEKGEGEQESRRGDSEAEAFCVLPCGHAFGHACMDQWLRIRLHTTSDGDTTTTCPSCRASLRHERCGHVVRLRRLEYGRVSNMRQAIEECIYEDQLPGVCKDCAEGRSFVDDDFYEEDRWDGVHPGPVLQPQRLGPRFTPIFVPHPDLRHRAGPGTGRDRVIGRARIIGIGTDTPVFLHPDVVASGLHLPHVSPAAATPRPTGSERRRESRRQSAQAQGDGGGYNYDVYGNPDNPWSMLARSIATGELNANPQVRFLSEEEREREIQARIHRILTE
ncbi:hypothetical protein F5Y17DRAFT_160796 [Xylariaceae sp. FL0594]|nr:hypothetical protein F5Y17DRAFT_160796 [Xylariaceae sp. FL0594]